MDPNQINDVVAQVVAWHNRHPLARHITPWQVHNVGVVALPFVEEESAGAPRSEPGPPSEPWPRSQSQPSAAGSDASRPFGSLRARANAQNSPRDEGLSVFADPPEGFERPRPRPWWERLNPKQLFAPRGARGPGSRSGSDRRFRAVFTEDFIASFSVAEVARWSARHGLLARPGEADWPVREVPADPSLLSRGRGPVGRSVTLYLPTAAVEVGGQRARVLVGRGHDAEVLGSRVWSPWRVGSAAALTLAGLGLGVLSMMSVSPSSDQVAEAPAVAAPPAAPPRVASASAPESVPPAPLASAPAPLSTLVPSVAASAAAGAASARPTASTIDTGPQVTLVPLTESARSPAASAPGLSAPQLAISGAKAPASVASAMLVATTAATTAAASSAVPRTASAGVPTLRGSVRPELDGALKQALKRQSEELRAVSLAERGPRPAAAPTQATTAAAKEAAPGAGAAKVRPTDNAKTNALSVEPMPDALQDIAKAGARVYALAARSTRIRADSEALLIQMRSSAANTPPPKGSRIEVLEGKAGWRAIWWPFVKREDAERARQALARRGLKVEIIDF